MVKSILLVGVGGQGTILASNILSKGLIEAGYDVKMSEIHGMSQRGGSVSTQIRFGEKVHAPVIGPGDADVVVAFEKSEALRALPFLKKGGKLLVNDYEIYSVPVITGKAQYPDNIIETLATVADVKSFNALSLAEEAGNQKTQNIVLLGAMVNALGLSNIDFAAIIRDTVPAKLVDVNLKAFQLGLGL